MQDGPEALIYQHLTLTLNGGSGGRGAPCPSVPAESAAPPPVDRLRVGAPHPCSLRCFLPKHNLLTEEGHGSPPSLARQQCREDRRWREVPPDFRDEIAARPRPRRTELQRVLRRIHARIAVVATRCRVGSVEPNPRRLRPPDRPRLTDPECGGKFRDTSVPAIQTGGTRRAPPLLPPKWCRSPSLP